MILLFGASASGKTEIAKYLQKHYGIQKAVTHTTRPMREGEAQDRDYHFVSKERFRELLEAGAFVETAAYNGNDYGSSKAEVSDEKAIILEPQGVESYLALGDPRIVVFYLDCPKEIRARRMASRGDKSEDIARRLANDDASFAEGSLPHYDFRLATAEKSVAELSAEVYRLYLEALKSR